MHSEENALLIAEILRMLHRLTTAQLRSVLIFTSKKL